jgi:hypothetical protein
LEKPVDGRDCNYFFISSSLPSGSVTEGDSLHNERSSQEEVFIKKYIDVFRC